MDDILLEHLITCREWIEHFCDKNNFPSCTAGACAIAAGVVMNQLQRAGYRCTVGYNSGHCFNLIDGDTLVDITATQFDIHNRNFLAKGVLFGKYEDYRRAYPDYYSIDRELHSTVKLANLLDSEGWPIEQHFSRHHLDQFRSDQLYAFS